MIGSERRRSLRWLHLGERRDAVAVEVFVARCHVTETREVFHRANRDAAAAVRHGSMPEALDALDEREDARLAYRRALVELRRARRHADRVARSVARHAERVAS